MNDVKTFFFRGDEIRVFPAENGDLLFVAKDVALALEYEWNGNKTVGHIPDEWKRVESVSTLRRGEQSVLTLTEQGLYFFLCRSDKPKARPFQKWLAGIVLPLHPQDGILQPAEGSASRSRSAGYSSPPFPFRATRRRAHAEPEAPRTADEHRRAHRAYGS